MPRYRVVLVFAFAALFVTLTIWQVMAQRDDWPLSSYPMYSGLQSTSFTRHVLVGVSEAGEFRLTSAQTSPFSGARLRHLIAKVARDPHRQQVFTRELHQRYEQQRVQRGWPVLLEIRVYAETWPIRPGLHGIDEPNRRRLHTLKFPRTTS